MDFTKANSYSCFFRLMIFSDKEGRRKEGRKEGKGRKEERKEKKERRKERGGRRESERGRSK